MTRIMLAGLACVVLAVACGEDKTRVAPRPALEIASQTSVAVTPSAPATLAITGTRSSLDRVVVEIPAGAVEAPVSIGASIAEDATPPPEGRVAVGPTIRLEPDGQRFAIPVTVRIPFVPDALPSGTAIDDVSVVVTSKSGNEELRPTAIDPRAGTVTVALTHFSDATPTVKPPPARAPAGAPGARRELAGKPTADLVMDRWLHVANLSSNDAALVAALAALPDPATPYQFADGGYELRTDFYAITVCLPENLSARSVLEKVRDDPNRLGAGRTKKFNDNVTWPPAAAGGRRLHEVVNLDIWGPDDGAIAYLDVDVSDAEFCVMTVQNSRWTLASSGTHPVSGARCWGYRDLAPCSTLFYTAGIESANTWGTQGIGSYMQTELWTGLMEAIGYEAVAAGGSTCMMHEDIHWHMTKGKATKAKKRAGGTIARADLEETVSIDESSAPPDGGDCACCAAKRVDGNWDSKYGCAAITQSEDTVSATVYGPDGERSTIEGKMIGAKLEFTYSATTGDRGTGMLHALADDHLSGSFKSDGGFSDVWHLARREKPCEIPTPITVDCYNECVRMGKGFGGCTDGPRSTSVLGPANCAEACANHKGNSVTLTPAEQRRVIPISKCDELLRQKPSDGAPR